MTYCISDIHGCYNEFEKLLSAVSFTDDDTLYILGDAVDRGYDSLKCLLRIMDAPNMHMLMGNHEKLMINGLKYDDKLDWFYNGGKKTLDELSNYNDDVKNKITEYLLELPYHFTYETETTKFLLVHAGIRVNPALAGEQLESIMAYQNLDDLIWIRESFINYPGLPGYTIIFGHTPTQYLRMADGSSPPVWHDETFGDKIAIDGGCVYGIANRGALNAICLDNMKKFTVYNKN
ncbi:MAG: serine/threonine protein phosphatase [Defluviitaleaceae bacterium]|nr:serine/threonine protein phosphatase [Defluviitaleaceae bacterium]